ncbi:uncharacterized protein LOC132561169 [Ylistrum balloti]|uniref:uncharacterized protein LOC132561169 n=1 Tax=Ylistrum balloti TaxID=509963 RepID=UPI002905A14F|nr:uncharacterized protein LOC132561169 [Ylistrum balloti]
MKEAIAVLRASRYADTDLAFLSLWDMGGHMSFQASHNVFISSHGVYLLVFRLTDFLRNKLETVRLKKWIRIIGTFSSCQLNAPQTRTYAPPIIFVGTFLDKLKENEDHDKQIDMIRSSISKFPELSVHRFVKFCTVDNSLGDEDNDLEMLRGLITEAAVHQDQWDRQLPTTWLKLEMDLHQLREKGKRILTIEEIIEMNKSSPAPLTDVNEIKLALEYLHCTRSVIYFREFDHVINDPQWLVDFFSILITDDQFLTEGDLLMARDQELYKTKGELTQELIEGLLRLEKNQDFIPHKSILLALMEKFGLIVKMQLSGSESEHRRFSEKYTIPSKLMELQNIDVITREVTRLKRRFFVSKALCLVFNDVYVPDELFHRIFAEILRTYTSTSLSTQSLEITTEMDQMRPGSGNACLYRGFGCFEINDLCGIILSMQPERSTIAVTIFSRTETVLPEGCGKLVKVSIERILRDALEMSNQQHFQHTYKLHCNFFLGPYDTPVDLFGVIHSERGVPCKGVECLGQHLLSRIDAKFWDITQDSVRVPVHRSISEPANEDTTFPDRRPTPRELGRLSRLVSASSYQLLFTELGVPIPDIDYAKNDLLSLSTVTLITKLFLNWSNAYPNQTFQHITQAMKNVGMATDRVVEMVETEAEPPGEVPSEVLGRSPTDSEIQQIINYIDISFYNLYLEIGLSPPIIEQQMVNYHQNIRGVLTALLHCWRDTFQEEATIGRLLTAMKMCGMDWYTTAKIWPRCQGEVVTRPKKEK